MNNQGKFLWLIIYFTLVSLMAAGYVMAQDKSRPPSPPPITEKIGGFTGRPATNKPPTDPPAKVNHDQALSGGGITKASIKVLSPARVSDKEFQVDTTLPVLLVPEDTLDLPGIPSPDDEDKPK